MYFHVTLYFTIYMVNKLEMAVYVIKCVDTNLNKRLFLWLYKTINCLSLRLEIQIDQSHNQRVSYRKSDVYNAIVNHAQGFLYW